MSKKETNQTALKKDYGFWAFTPLLVFLLLFFGVGIFFTAIGTENAFKQISKDFALLIAVVVAILMCKGSFAERTMTFARHCARPGIMQMVVIFVLAGAFAGLCKEMGAVTSTVNLGIHFIPRRFLVAGLFVLCAFMSTSMGTSLGTLSAVIPIAIGFAESANLDMAMTMCAILGGSFFGDNLSIISDTTIAATQSAGCEMRDKFRMNFKIALPAALVAILLFSIFSAGGEVTGDYPFQIVKVLPYLAVLVTAIAGLDVVVVLAGGIVLAALVGFGTASLTLQTLSSSITSGIAGMSSIILLAIFMGGISGIATEYGGMNWLTSKFNKGVKTRKGAQWAMVGMISLIDFFIGNNGIAILTTTPLVKPLAKKYKIAPERMASLLDIFSCIIPGISPVATSILMVIAATDLSPLDLLTKQFYLYALAIFAILSIELNLFQTPAEKAGEEFYPELDEENA